MSPRNPSQNTTVLKAFKKKKVLMIDELSGLLGCSVVTARRRLKQWKACTSYNQNGRYYVLPDIAKFDKWEVSSLRQRLQAKINDEYR